MTIRLPEEEHERLRQLAERRKINMNKLMDELSTLALPEFNAETRFQARGRWDRARRDSGCWRGEWGNKKLAEAG